MFVEISRGRSFKGLAQYCLHDVGAKTSDRVAFVETRNLGTTNPHLGWRIMAARHYLQDELKQKAGVGRGGAKDGKPVGHLLISWRSDEAQAQKLDRATMLKAALGALRSIGADDRQALIIGHADTDHPHCHIIINLVGDDGRLKSNWKEKAKLSKFALQQELEIHGEAIVKTREQNWLDRKAGETPTPVKKQPRHFYDLDQAAESCEELAAFAADHKQKLAAHSQAQEALRRRHRRQQQRLLDFQKKQQTRAAELTASVIRASKTEIRKAYRPTWRALLDRQTVDRRAFERNEANLKGTLANAMALINWKQVLRRRRHSDQLGLADAFQILTSEAVRRAKFRHRHQAEHDRLRSRQRQEEHAQERQLQQSQAQQLKDHRSAYLKVLQRLKLRQSKSNQKIKEELQSLTKERNDALKAYRDRQRAAEFDREVCSNVVDGRLQEGGVL